MKIYAKMDPKSDPEIDVWPLEGSIFEVLGEFLRSRIFDEFSIGKKSAKSLQFSVWGVATGAPRGIWGCGRRIGRGPSEGQESAEIGRSVWHAFGTPLRETGAAHLKGSALPADPQRIK